VPSPTSPPFPSPTLFRSRARCVTDNIGVIRTLIQNHLAVGVLPEYSCEGLLADRRLRATLLPKRRDVWLLVQNHLKRDAAARVRSEEHTSELQSHLNLVC